MIGHGFYYNITRATQVWEYRKGDNNVNKCLQGFAKPTYYLLMHNLRLSKSKKLKFTDLIGRKIDLVDLVDFEFGFFH